jgi:endonuclease/exonuclease/phosphatase (EEP) superfamily protein YafD
MAAAISRERYASEARSSTVGIQQLPTHHFPARYQRPALLAIMAISLALALGFFGDFHPALDAFAQLRLHLAVLLALVALPLLFTPLRIEAVVALVFSAAALSTTYAALRIPGLSPVQAGFVADAGDRAVYRLLQLNLRFDNPAPEKVLSLIGRAQPDVVTLEEVSPMWKDKLDLLAKAYPHRIVCSSPHGSSGVAILSRRPFAADSEPYCSTGGALALASVDFGGTPVDVVALHLRWPWPFAHGGQASQVAIPLSSLGPTAVVAGDCNAVPWSATVRQLATAGGLTPMPSVGPTWQYIKLPELLRFSGLPIDQVFSRGAVLIHSATRLEPVGSDHLPVMVQFSLRPQPGQPENEGATAFASTGPELAVNATR